MIAANINSHRVPICWEWFLLMSHQATSFSPQLTVLYRFIIKMNRLQEIRARISRKLRKLRNQKCVEGDRQRCWTISWGDNDACELRGLWKPQINCIAFSVFFPIFKSLQGGQVPFKDYAIVKVNIFYHQSMSSTGVITLWGSLSLFMNPLTHSRLERGGQRVREPRFKN